MSLNEKTSAHVASIAGRILKMAKPIGMSDELYEDMRTLAASVLTQATDKTNQTLDSMYNALVDKKRPIYKPFSNIYRRYISIPPL